MNRKAVKQATSSMDNMNLDFNENQRSGVMRGGFQAAEHTIPIDKMADSMYEEEPARGCLGDPRPAEALVIANNDDVYATTMMPNRGAGHAVWGGPTAGTRLTERMEMRDDENFYWNTASPMVPDQKPPQHIAPRKDRYWGPQEATKPRERSCFGNFFGHGALFQEEDQHIPNGGHDGHMSRGCAPEGGMFGSPEPDIPKGWGQGQGRSAPETQRAAPCNPNGRGIGPDWKPNRGRSTCMGLGESERFCGAPEEYFHPREDLTETQYWGKAKSHGVNEVQAPRVQSRWEKLAAVQGTYSTKEYDGVVHAVKPMHQADAIPTQAQIETFWHRADEQSLHPYSQKDAGRKCGLNEGQQVFGRFQETGRNDLVGDVNVHHRYHGIDNLKHPRNMQYQKSNENDHQKLYHF